MASPRKPHWRFPSVLVLSFWRLRYPAPSFSFCIGRPLLPREQAEVSGVAGSHVSPGPVSARKREVLLHADEAAAERQEWLSKASFFHSEDLDYLKFLIPQGARVLGLGCGTGHLLAVRRPKRGRGVDLSAGMVAPPRRSNPDLAFVV